MNSQILYCGDTSLTSAASYLAGLLHHNGLTFDYLSSDQPLTSDRLGPEIRLYVLSDYPATRVDSLTQEKILLRVRQGAGLLMIGGWESYQGSGGFWHGTRLSEAFPVEISPTDDRRNCDSPVFAVVDQEHPIVEGLPWRQRPPLIGGYNRVTPKAEGQVVLSARRYRAMFDDTGAPQLGESSCDPLLVVGRFGQGRVAALTTDLAPHWVGPLVDWGDGRVVAQAPGAEGVEVGDLYARFVGQLIRWTWGPSHE